MSWRSVTLTLDGDAACALGDALLACGAITVDLSDADAGTDAEQPAFAEPGAQIAPWRHSRLTATFAADAEIETLLAAACRTAGVQHPAQSAYATLEDCDWVRLSQRQFKPLRISARLWIVPTWAIAPEPDAINLRLDPGAAFGTGSHASTRLCLQWLERNIRPEQSVLDFGCGSGILAVAAARLGAGRVCGIDIDRHAVLAARANAMQNQVNAEFFAPGEEPQRRYHVVIANILANPLIALAPLLAAATLPGGSIALSGVLEAQAQEVICAYQAWFDLGIAALDEGWVLIAGSRLQV